MSGSRLGLAFPDGRRGGRLLLVGAGGRDDLGCFDPAADTWIEQSIYHDCQALSARGYNVAPQADGNFDTIVVFVPRARASAFARIAGAVMRLEPGGVLWIDGQKTDGIDSILKEMRNLTGVDEVHSKAHGKIFRIERPDPQLIPAAWHARPVEVTPGFVTRPGVFSADGIDPGSALLVRHLPARLPTRLVDLGAGWGWLAAKALEHPEVKVLHLVEADHHALQSARDNIADPRARFHWSDARDFHLPEPVNGVIMNPPFHNGRKADPALGTAFIAAAARLLTGAGHLWMVANRHLPYESALHEHFAQVTDLGGDNRFKLFMASGAGRGGNRQRGRR